ncbi:MAG: SDR family oxidoreductase [Chloroflexi bacterium]|nr:SDR family oxidoreductase [Chloroflexota bacterium]
MPRKLEDAVVVITGASSGIGRAAALAFARHGATVVAAARRELPLQEVATACENLGGRALVAPTDTADEPSVQELARRAIENFGRIDVWVNNAAVTLFARFEESPPDAYRRVLETNLFGYIHGARAALPYFREQGSGILINVASVVGVIGQPYTSAYVASKFAIRGLSASLRMETLDAPDIHVCTVLPASIDTPLFQHAANYTGRAVRPMSPVYAADHVAAAIVRLAEAPQREVFVGNAGRLLGLLHSVAPGLAERLLARQVDRSHFQERSAPPTPGNLFRPMPEWTSVSGGWRAPTGRALGGAALVGLAAFPAAVAAWQRTRTGLNPPWPFRGRRRKGLGRLPALAAWGLGLISARRPRVNVQL